jgi:hypothetical protein
MEEQGTAFRGQGAERPGAMFIVQGTEERVRELETENARLKSLVGELLVANQLLREKCREQSSAARG